MCYGRNDLSKYGITVPNTFRNLNPAKLYEEAIRYEPKTTISSAGALIAYSGAKTGRCPKDKRIVKHPTSEKDIWWGPVNFPMEEHYFQINRERAKDYQTGTGFMSQESIDGLVAGLSSEDPHYLFPALMLCSISGGGG